MSKSAFVVLVASLVLSVSAAADDRKKTTEDPREFAAKMLKLYRAKDVKQLLDHSTMGPTTPRMLARMAPGTSRYNSLFGDESWRWKAVKSWNEKLFKVKYRRNAWVQFTRGTKDQELGFINMKMEGNQWKFDLIDHSSAQSLSSDMNLLSARYSGRAALAESITSVLKAHQKKDVEGVLKAAISEGPSVLAYLSPEDEAKPKSDLLFSKEIMRDVDDWDGKIRDIYLSETALVEFGREDSSVYVVTLERDGAGWKFEDIHSPDIQDMRSLND